MSWKNPPTHSRYIAQPNPPAIVEPAQLAVTTGNRPQPEDVEKAQKVAQDIGYPYVPRLSFQAMHERDGLDLYYVVRRDRHELCHIDGRAIFVNPGMFALKTHMGKNHPLIVALGLDQERITENTEKNARAVVVDATLGLAGDAMHIAATGQAEIIGLEKSPVIASLLREGLARMSQEQRAWASSAQKIIVKNTDAATALSSMADHSVDCVYLDPMFERRQGGVPGFGLFRAVAAHDKLLPDTLLQAARVARRRVVLKISRYAPWPDFWPWSLDESEQLNTSGGLAYLIRRV